MYAKAYPYLQPPEHSLPKAFWPRTKRGEPTTCVEKGRAPAFENTSRHCEPVGRMGKNGGFRKSGSPFWESITAVHLAPCWCLLFVGPPAPKRQHASFQWQQLLSWPGSPCTHSIRQASSFALICVLKAVVLLMVQHCVLCAYFLEYSYLVVAAVVMTIVFLFCSVFLAITVFKATPVLAIPQIGLWLL